MNSQSCQIWGWLGYWGVYLVPLLIVLLIVRVLNRKNWQRLDEQYKKSWANQETMITLLKEIRDALKK